MLVMTIVYFRKTSEERRLRPIPVLFTPAREMAYVCPVAGGDMALVIEDVAS